MAKQKKKWQRTPLEGERGIIATDQRENKHAAFFGIASNIAILSYLAHDYVVVTCADLKTRNTDARVPIAKNKELTEETVKRCSRAWGIQHFPVVVYPEGTPIGSATELREEAIRLYAEGAVEVKETATEMARGMQRKASELVQLYRLYITVERRIEGTDTTLEEEVLRDQTIDPEVAQKLIKYRETVGYLREVLSTVVRERFNGQFNIVDAYREIGPPSQEQARIALDIALTVSEFCYQINQVVAHNGLSEEIPEYTVETVADLSVAALFANSSLWPDHSPASNHAALSAHHYLAMRQRMPKLPPVEKLIEDHGRLWPSNWVYCVEAETTAMVDGQSRKSVRFDYRTSNRPNQSSALKRAIVDNAGLISLDLTQSSFDVQVWPLDLEHLMHVTVLSVAEYFVEAQHEGKSVPAIFEELSARMKEPQYENYRIEEDLSTRLSIYSYVLAAAAREYRLFPKGGIVLFTNGTGEGYREAAIKMEVEGGIAVVVSANPVEFVFISHEQLNGRLLGKPASIQEFITPTMGPNRLPKQRFVTFGVGTNKQVFQNRGNMLGVADLKSLAAFISSREEELNQARSLTAKK